MNEVEWILLEDELPDRHGEYLVKNDEMEGVSYFGGDHWASPGYWKGNIIAWARKTYVH